MVRVLLTGILRLVAGAAVLAGAGPVGAMDYYVDPAHLGGTCDDHHRGTTLDLPLCTITACLGQRLEPGDRCILRAGEYPERLTPATSGAPEDEIVIGRYADERVVLLGTLDEASGPGIRRRDRPGVTGPLPDLDLRDSSWLRFDGIVFWNVRLELAGSHHVTFHRCVFDEGPRSAEADPTSISIHGTATEKLAPHDSFPQPGAPGQSDDLDAGPVGGSDNGRASPLPIASGGTGATTAPDARANLGTAAESEVVHLDRAETVTGEKTFSSPLHVQDVNSMRHSSLFESVEACVNDLYSRPGACWVDASEDDPTAFADTNPASETSGKKDALVVDARRGGLRFLSSMPEYPTGSAAPGENLVPFVFQVRLDDPTRTLDQDPGAIGEWNCGADVGGQNTDWFNCPRGNTSWGQPGGSKQFWHSGQCNALVGSNVSDYGICGGPHIFEVRYPETSRHPAKPIFAVGNGGASLYEPEERTVHWRSWLTMFRSDTWPEPDKANTPMFTFDRLGAFFDGGFFVGATVSWPQYTTHLYPNFNAWIQHDIALHLPAFVVEGSDDPTVGETAPIAKFYDRSQKGGYAHPGNAGEAFGFYNNSRLYMGSFCHADDDGCTDSLAEGQFIEWEGNTVDANTVRLKVDNPTAPRMITLPDASGWVALADAPGNRITCGEAIFDPPAMEARSGGEAVQGAPGVSPRSACSCSPAGLWHDDVLMRDCSVLADGSLTVRLYNAGSVDLADDDTGPQIVDFCCIAK